MYDNATRLWITFMENEKTGKFILSKLFGSAARVRILKFFLSHPDGRYYIRQVARDLDLQLNSVRRELENLEQFGLLQSTGASGKAKKAAMTASSDIAETDGGMAEQNFDTPETENLKETGSKTDKKYFFVNKEFILFEEIKALFIKAQVLYERDFSEKILEIGRPELLILSGFFVNEENTPTDILIVGKLDRERINKVISDLERELDRELNYTLMDMDEFIYRRDITDVFLYSILDSKKMVVIDELSIS